MQNSFGSNIFEAYGNSYMHGSSSGSQGHPEEQGSPFGFAQAQHRAQMQGQMQPQMQAQAQYQAQMQAQAQYQAQVQAQYQAQVQAQRQAQVQAQRQAQMQAQRQAQMQGQMQGMDPRYQHNYTVPQLRANASTQEQMAYQNMMANRAQEAQRRQYAMLKKEQDKQITHVLYIDPREEVCEDSYKLCIGLPMVHIVDVNNVTSDQVPECVTFLPAIVDVRGQGGCYRGSKCEQYITRKLIPRKQTAQRFIDMGSPSLFRLDVDDITKQEPMLESEIGSLEGAYDKWPKFSSDPVKAKSQSDSMLRKLKQRIDRLNIKVDEPVADMDGNTSATNTKIQAELRRREKEAQAGSNRRGPAPTFIQQLP